MTIENKVFKTTPECKDELGPSSLKYNGRPLVRIAEKTIAVGVHHWTTYTPADDEMSDTIFEYCADCGKVLKTQ